MKNRPILLLCFFLSLNCQRRQNNSSLTIELSVKSEKNERFKFYYLTNNNKSYSEEYSQTIEIKGDSSKQTFSFNPATNPNQFRIDLGESGNINEIFVYGVRLFYGSDTIIIGKKELHRFFNPNVYVEMQEGKMLRKQKEGRYDPFIQSTDLLHQKMFLEFFN